MLKKWIIASILCASVVLAACSAVPATITVPTGIPTSIPTQILTAIPALETALPPDAAKAIENKVSELLGVSVESITLKSIEKKDWPNSCLGLPEANEACSDVVTPGWLVVFTANGQDYRFRVDQTGTMIRREP